MAYANATRSIETGLMARFGAVYRNFVEAQRQRKVYNVTVRELSALTHRELSDLGIHQSMISKIAYDAAYGK